jgi:riboflavin synthase
MFTGIVDDVGTIVRVVPTDAGREFAVACRYDDLVPGESIALNGACLTVREARRGWFAVAAVVTTLERTTLGSWRDGTRVNLERALRAGDRLGGHLVQGHVDGVGTVGDVVERDDALLIDVDLPAAANLVVPHGSICIDGVSLTVNEVRAEGRVQVAIIEYTRRHTTLGTLAPGARVHIEADVIGKYVRSLMHDSWAAERAS